MLLLGHRENYKEGEEVEELGGQEVEGKEVEGEEVVEEE